MIGDLDFFVVHRVPRLQLVDAVDHLIVLINLFFKLLDAVCRQPARREHTEKAPDHRPRAGYDGRDNFRRHSFTPYAIRLNI